MAAFSGPTLRLRPQRALPLWCGHPWVVAGALDAQQGLPSQPGVVRLVDDKDRPIDFGLYEPEAAICIRLMGVGTSWPRDWPADGVPWAWWEARLEAAREARLSLDVCNDTCSAYRLVNAEGDGVPGLVVDWLAGVARLSVASRGMERWVDRIAQWLVERMGARHVAASFGEDEHAESGSAIRWLTQPHEGLVEIQEDGLRLLVDVLHVGTTEWRPEGRFERVLFARTAQGGSVMEIGETFGGVALHAAYRGASRAHVVVAEEAAAGRIREVARRNGLERQVSVEVGGLQGALASQLGRGHRHRLVALHPPCLARERKSLPAALRIQRTLARDGLKITEEGGRLVLPSTSRWIGEAELLRALVDALGKARLQAVVESTSAQDATLPWPASMSEGRASPWVVLRRLARG